MLKLFDYWRSTAAYRVRMALCSKFVPYETQSVHLVKNGGEQHSQEYVKTNASELVPTLQLESGECIGQSLAIIQYLDDKYPEPALIPSGIQKIRALEIAAAIGCDLHPLNNLRVLQYLEQELKVSTEDKSKWYHHWVMKGFATVEAKLKTLPQQSAFAIGEDASIADIFIVAQVYNALRFDISLDQFPRIQEIDQHCQTLPWVKKAYPKDPEITEQ